MEINREIERYELDQNKTIAYFIDHIQCDKTLSARAIEKINFKEGIFFTFLPKKVNSSRLYDFSNGGLLPTIPYGNKTYRIEGIGEFHPQQVITMRRECSNFIIDYLQNEKSCAIVENYMLNAISPHAQIKNVKMIPYKEEVYFFLSKKNSKEEIDNTINKSTEIWHSLCMLAKIKIPTKLDNSSFDEICDHTEYIITGAYDGEGYIFWEKNLKT